MYGNCKMARICAKWLACMAIAKCVESVYYVFDLLNVIRGLCVLSLQNACVMCACMCLTCTCAYRFYHVYVCVACITNAE